MLSRNQLYAGIVDVLEYGVRGKRNDARSGYHRPVTLGVALQMRSLILISGTART
jgi:hypothetical protein